MFACKLHDLDVKITENDLDDLVLASTLILQYKKAPKQLIYFSAFIYFIKL